MNLTNTKTRKTLNYSLCIKLSFDLSLFD